MEKAKKAAVKVLVTILSNISAISIGVAFFLSRSGGHLQSRLLRPCMLSRWPGGQSYDQLGNPWVCDSSWYFWLMAD